MSINAAKKIRKVSPVDPFAGSAPHVSNKVTSRRRRRSAITFRIPIVLYRSVVLRVYFGTVTAVFEPRASHLRVETIEKFIFVFVPESGGGPPTDIVFKWDLSRCKQKITRTLQVITLNKIPSKVFFFFRKCTIYASAR